LQSLIESTLITTHATSPEATATDATSYRPRLCAAVLLSTDSLTAVALSALCLQLYRLFLGALPAFPPRRSTSMDLVLLFAGVIAYLALKGRYHQRIPFWTETRLVTGASLGAIGLECAATLLAGGQGVRWAVVGSLLLFAPFATLANHQAKHALSRLGLWTMPVVFVGDGSSVAATEAALNSDRSLGYRIVRCISSFAVLADAPDQPLRRTMERYGARQILIAMAAQGDLHGRVIEAALHERVPFAILPQPGVFPAFAYEATHFFGHNAIFLSFRDGLSDPLARTSKLMLDVTVATLLLLLTAPLFLFIVALSWLDGGPALFMHTRVGARGRRFRCLKFRTMVVDSERVLQEALASQPALAAEWAATRKLHNDPRITPLGRFLRKTSLDELPQLINVLRLEMSLVGPRPIVESEVSLYGDAIAQYYAIRPGLTGLWQVSGRSNTSYQQRVQLDVWYVNNWTIWHDIIVLLKTVPAILSRDGAV